MQREVAVLEQHPGAALHRAADQLARVTLLTLTHRDGLDAWTATEEKSQWWQALSVTRLSPGDIYNWRRGELTLTDE